MREKWSDHYNQFYYVIISRKFQKVYFIFKMDQFFCRLNPFIKRNFMKKSYQGQTVNDSFFLFV